MRAMCRLTTPSNQACSANDGMPTMKPQAVVAMAAEMPSESRTERSPAVASPKEGAPARPPKT